MLFLKEVILNYRFISQKKSFVFSMQIWEYFFIPFLMPKETRQFFSISFWSANRQKRFHLLSYLYCVTKLKSPEHQKAFLHLSSHLKRKLSMIAQKERDLQNFDFTFKCFSLRCLSTYENCGYTNSIVFLSPP